MPYRIARSLDRLRTEINTAWPDRSKASDGWIGDTAHQQEDSDHNPNSSGVVCALDITHDPAHGCDIDYLSDHLIRPEVRHPALKYVIANHLIAGLHTGWKWRQYTGSNPHTQHMHVSVGRGRDGFSTPPYDDTSTWHIAEPDTSFPLPRSYYFGWSHGPDNSISGWYGERFRGRSAHDWLNTWARALQDDGWPVGKGKKYLTKYGLDGMYGDEWHALAVAVQQKHGLTADGLIGPETWNAAFE